MDLMWYISGCGECCTADAQHQAALDVCPRQSCTGSRTGQGCQIKYSVIINIQIIYIIQKNMVVGEGGGELKLKVQGKKVSGKGKRENLSL